jgi:hypothetical protein
MKRLLGWLAVMTLLTMTQPALACTIPVYRYALERWDLGNYNLIIYHRGPLSTQDHAQIRRWQHPQPGNVDLVTVDLDGKVSPELQEIWKQQGERATLPWLVVRLPGSDSKAPSAWAGSFAPDHLEKLIDSPARQRMVNSLSRGETAVFVLLHGSEAKENEAAEQLVTKELRRLEKAIKLPEQSRDGPQLRLPLPLQVRFTVLPVRRDDVAEKAFVQLLLGTEEGLDKVKGPILFPIFGRGRALGSLFGKDLNAGEVFQVAQFLCKECSCQLKELNPGTDLLIKADWPGIFDRIMKSAK